jgi:hypothetical protein
MTDPQYLEKGNYVRFFCKDFDLKHKDMRFGHGVVDKIEFNKIGMNLIYVRWDDRPGSHIQFREHLIKLPKRRRCPVCRGWKKINDCTIDKVRVVTCDRCKGRGFIYLKGRKDDGH